MNRVSDYTALPDGPPNKIRQDYLNGMTYKSIAEKYHIDQRTAKRYVRENLPLSEYEHRSYTSALDPYKPLIRAWLSQGPVYASVIRNWLLEQGYSGSYTIVNRYVQSVIREYEEAGIYPMDVKRSRKAPLQTIDKKIKEEKAHAAYKRNQP